MRYVPPGFAVKELCSMDAIVELVSDLMDLKGVRVSVLVKSSTTLKCVAMTCFNQMDGDATFVPNTKKIVSGQVYVLIFCLSQIVQTRDFADLNETFEPNDISSFCWMGSISHRIKQYFCSSLFVCYPMQSRGIIPDFVVLFLGGTERIKPKRQQVLFVGL